MDLPGTLLLLSVQPEPARPEANRTAERWGHIVSKTQAALIWTPNSRTLVIRTPTERAPNL